MSVKTVKGVLATALLVAAAACAGLSASAIRYPNAPDFPPTDPAAVQILSTEPSRPHQRLAEITVAAAPNTAPSAQEVDAKLRAEAATLGANAVVLVVDPGQPPRVVASRTWWGTPLKAVTGRDVIGVAIRYR
jgi:hypothetical protein